MRWYNPKTRSSETVTAPRTDEGAERMLRGHRDSGAFLRRFEELRADGMPVEQAMIFVGHHIRMWHLKFRPGSRRDPRWGMIPNRTKPGPCGLLTTSSARSSGKAPSTHLGE